MKHQCPICLIFFDCKFNDDMSDKLECSERQSPLCGDCFNTVSTSKKIPVRNKIGVAISWREAVDLSKPIRPMFGGLQ